MSSITRASQLSTEPTTKKKFGKNLNKLTKPPVPSVASGSKLSSSSASSASSRNGLLLLSTKRGSNNGVTGTSSAGPVGGILSGRSSNANATKALPSLGLQYESNTSTHDVLLGAVVGASRYESHQQPDAWGVAEKQQKLSNGFDNGFFQPPQPEITSNVNVPQPMISHNPNERDFLDGTTSSNIAHGLPPPGLPYHETVTYNSWNDYGTRQRIESSVHSNNRVVTSPDVVAIDDIEGDHQEVVMSRLARERSEKRQAEEEARFHEQKERASQKLRDLEKKMATSPHHDIPLSIETKATKAVTDHNNRKPRVVLEKLNRSGVVVDDSKTQNPPKTISAPTERITPSRTLYDPNRTYSSLVGGGTKISNGDKVLEENAHTPDATSQPKQKGNKVVPGQQASQPASTTSASPANSPRDQSQQTGNVIHLSSYEDRDRGERKTNAGPRMLFDPKSGAMVAVPTREENSSNSNNNNTIRGRKDKKKGRNGRDKDISSPDPKNDNCSGPDKSKSSRKSKGRKDESLNNQRSRSNGVSATPTKTEIKKNRHTKNGRTLPRTCGVLFARDEKGVLYCKDGCDGDLGYGSHSVPGGRHRNPVAYAKFLEDHQQQNQLHESANFEDCPTDDNNNNNNALGGIMQQNPALSVQLQTGFTLPEPKEPKLDWVRPNEKIELITGIDDSPTLQATAKEWAPSHAALAAAAAAASVEQDNKASHGLSIGSLDGPEDDIVESDDDVPAFGLGFDPTLDMDSMIQSPTAAEPTSSIDVVNLASLSLAPALNPTTSRHIFAFESGSTWGSNSGNDGNDWGIPPSSNGQHPFVTDSFSKEQQARSVTAASFLSLSSTATWGAPPVSSLGTAHLGGDTGATGD